MTTLEQLKAYGREKYAQDAGEHAHNLLSAEDLDHLIEHTHTQTIQSVRERIGKGRKSVKDLWPEADIENPTELLAVQVSYKDGYNQALTDLLKDLEAPVEGDGV